MTLNRLSLASHLCLSGAIQAALDGPDGDLRAAPQAEPPHDMLEVVGDGRKRMIVAPH